MLINIQIIPHKEQRYETCGDWWVDEEGTTQVRISHLSDKRYERLVLIHELVEYLIELTKRDDNSSQLVAATDRFDQDYEARRHSDDNQSEPGCEPNCPVYKGHMAATAIENVAAMIFRVNYNDYAKAIAALDQSKDKP